MGGQVGMFRALGVGARAVRQNLPLWGLGLALEAGLALARLGFGLATLAMVLDGFERGAASAPDQADLGAVLASGILGALVDRVVWPLAGLWLALEVTGATLRAFYLGASVERLAASARDGRPEPCTLVASGAAVLARAWAATLWLASMELIVTLWRWVLWGAAMLVVARAFAQSAHGILAAAIAGVGAGLFGVVALLNALYARVYLVRSIRGPETPLAAAFTSGALLGQRALTYLGILVAQGVLMFGVATIAGTPGVAAAGAGTGQLGLQVSFRALGALISAALGALVELVVMGGICAVDLDSRGQLPSPPPPMPPAPPQPVLTAQEIVEADALPPKPEPSV